MLSTGWLRDIATKMNSRETVGVVHQRVARTHNDGGVNIGTCEAGREGQADSQNWAAWPFPITVARSGKNRHFVVFEKGQTNC